MLRRWSPSSYLAGETRVSSVCGSIYHLFVGSCVRWRGSLFTDQFFVLQPVFSCTLHLCIFHKGLTCVKHFMWNSLSHGYIRWWERNCMSAQRKCDRCGLSLFFGGGGGIRAVKEPLMRFLDHSPSDTHTHTYVADRTPLVEWSAWHRGLYLTTQNIHNRQTSMPPAGL